MEPLALEAERQGLKTPGTGQPSAEARRLLVFTAGGRRFAVPLTAVEAIVPMPPRLTRVPGAPTAVCGAMARRGAVFPVIRSDALACGWVAILNLAAGPLGVALTAVPTTLALPPDRIEPRPAASPLLTGRAALDDGGWAELVDPQARGMDLCALAAALAGREER